MVSVFITNMLIFTRLRFNSRFLQSKFLKISTTLLKKFQKCWQIFFKILIYPKVLQYMKHPTYIKGSILLQIQCTCESWIISANHIPNILSIVPSLFNQIRSYFLWFYICIFNQKIQP
jgi:hypothetical protein